MSLHSFKKTALLQLCNCMLACDLKNLEDLYNGDIFVDIISTSFPDFIQAEQLKTTGDSNENIQDDEKMNEAFETESKTVTTEDTEMQIVDVEAEYTEGLEVDTTCTPVEVSPVEEKVTIAEENLQNTRVDSVGANEEKMLQNYQMIEKFIDDKYSLQSSDIISYMACMAAKELELSKVACFLLSEVVKLCAFLHNDQLSTLALLDSRVQEDLEECFQLFILERESISKSSVERLLCHQAKYKSPSPVIRNSFITPRRSCTSKYRVDSPATPSNDDVFTNSPLKSFFESPVFKKEDLIRKDKEIAATRNILYEEELKTDDLKSQINELKEKLHKKDDEIQKLKETVKALTESEKVKDEDIKKLMEEKEESTKAFRATENEYKRECSTRMSEITMLQKEVKDCLNGTCKSGNVLKDFMVMKKDLQREKERSKQLQVELKLTKESLKNKSKELKDVNAQLQNVAFDFVKNESFYKEKLNELKMDKKDEPNSPGSGEIIGSIIEEENKMLRRKLNAAESKIKELEEKLEKFEMLEKDCIPTHQNTRVLSMPDLVDMSETQNLQDLQNEKELPNSLNVCDMSSSSENVSKNSFQVCDNSTKTQIITKSSFGGCDISSNSEDASNNLYNRCDSLGNSDAVSNNSFTGCDISMNSRAAEKTVYSSKQRWTEVPFADPTVELYGTLWKNLNLDNGDGACKDEELNDSGRKNTIESLTFHEFLNLLKISSINDADRYNLGDIFADKKSDADYLSSILKGQKSKRNVAKLAKDFRVFKELLSCLFIFVNSNSTLPTDNFYDWVRSHLENGHRKTNEESQLEKKVADYAYQLKNKENEIEKLEMSHSIFQGKLEQYEVQLQEKNKCIEKLEMKCKEKDDIGRLYIKKYEKCKERLLSMMEMEKENSYLRNNSKIMELEKKKLVNAYECLSEKFNSCMAKKLQQIQHLETKIEQERKSNIAKENTIAKLKSERDKYLLKAKELAKNLRDKDSAVISNHKYDVARNDDNNDLEFVTEPSLPRRSKREHFNVSHLSESFYPDFNSTASRDFSNESTLSGALYSKNGLVGQFVSHDEESFFNQSSLEDIKNVTKPVDRLDELKRRNSLYPHHMQSSYPLEVNLTPSANKNLYVKNQESLEHSETASKKQESDIKKRKFDEVEPETQSNEVLRTPLMKMKRAIRNSSSMKKIMFYRRNRPCVIKPKP